MAEVKPVVAMGMVYSPDLTRILLIRKNKPDFLAGCWIPPGGHIEPGETPEEAARREVQEECGILIPKWTFLQIQQIEWGPMPVFVTSTPAIDYAKTCTDELVQVWHTVHIEAGHLKTTPDLLGLHRAAIERLRRLQMEPA